MSSEPLDVSLRVRMRYDAGGAARQALGDLGQVEAQARKLGAVDTDRLGRALRATGEEAAKAERRVADLSRVAARFGAVSTVPALSGELRVVTGAAQGAGQALAGTVAQAAKFGTAAPGAREMARELRLVARAAKATQGELKDLDAAAERVARHDLGGLGRGLDAAVRSADALQRRLDALDRRHSGGGSRGGGYGTRFDFGNEALMASGLGGGFRFGMGGAALGGLAAGTGIVGTAAATARATREAISFESAMAEVRKAVDDISPDALSALERTILRTSTATGIAKEKLAELVAEAGYSGVPKEDLARFAEFGAKAAGAFKMPEGETGDRLAKLRTNFGLTQTALEDVADGINVLADSGSAKERQIIDFLERTSGAGKALRIVPLNLAAMGSAIISTGRASEVAGTGFNALAMKLGMADSQSKEFKEGLRSLGLSARQVKADMAIRPEETMLSVLERINKLPQGKGLEVAGKIGGGEYADDILIAAGSVDQLRASLAKMQDQAARSGSVEKTFKIFDATTERSLARAGASIDAFAARIGKTFTPAVREAAGAVERWFNGMNKAMDRRAEAEELAKRMVGGETLTPKDKARIDADPRLKSEVDKAEFYQRRQRELETNRERAGKNPGSLPSQEEFRQKFEGRAREWEERRQRALNPPALPPASPPDASAVPGTGKRSDLSSEARVSLAGYHEEVERGLARTERVVDEAGRRMRDDLAIGAKVDLAALRLDPSQQIRIERASLGGGLLGRGGGAGGGAGVASGSGSPRIAPGRFGGPIPPGAGERYGGAPEAGRSGGGGALRDGPAGDGGAHRRFGDGGGTRGAARTGQMMAYAMDQLRREGAPEASLREGAGHLVGQAHMESGLDPNKSHDGGTGFGIYGARDPSPGRGRRTDMLNWLKRNGYAANSAEGQMRYMAHEAMSGRYGQTRRILMGEGSGDLDRDTDTITREFERPAVINRRSGAVRNAIRVGPEGAAAGTPEGGGAAQAGENGRFDPLGGAARRYSSGYGLRDHPIRGGRRMHHGQDMAAPGGTAVHAMQGGRVTRIDRSGDVTVTHADGSTKTYRHIAPGGLREGQSVEGGAQLGSLRHRDPRSTGPHLHLEATDPQGRRYDPRAEIEAAGRRRPEAAAERPLRQISPWTRRPDGPAAAAPPERRLPEPGEPGARSGRFSDPRMLEVRARPSAEPAAGGRAGGGGGFGGSVTQHFHGGFDEQTVARRAKLEQNRSIRQAQARALHGIGRLA